MKKIFTTTTVIVLGVLITLTVACKKSSTSTTTTTTTTGGTTGPTASMVASYTAGGYSSGTGTTTAAFTNTLVAVSQGGSQYGIQGSLTSGGQPLTIYLNANITGTGTLALGASGNYAQFIVGPASSTTSVTYATGYPTANPGSGVLNITAFSTSTRLISGTFSYTAGTATQGAPTTVVNNGSFSNVGF